MSGTPEQRKGKVPKWIRPAFAGLAVIFLVYTAFDLKQRWDGAPVRVEPSWLLFAVMSSILAMLLQLAAFRALVHAWTGRTMPKRASARVYMDSQMARYTPGKVALPAVRIAGAGLLGVEPRVMAATLAGELLSWLGAGTMIGATVIGLLLPEQQFLPEVVLAARVSAVGAFLGLGWLVLVDRSRLPAALLKFVGASGQGPLLPLSVPLLHLAHFLMWTLCGALLCRAVGADWLNGLLTGGLLCAGIVVGFLAFLAPAGAGVREAVLVMGVSPLLGSSAAVAVGILARMVSLVSDVGLWIWFRFRARSQSDS
jgi:hypothetical protein